MRKQDLGSAAALSLAFFLTACGGGSSGDSGGGSSSAEKPASIATGGLGGTELERARVLWERKFGAPAPDAAGRARQVRFLLARGFASDTVRRVVRGVEDDF